MLFERLLMVDSKKIWHEEGLRIRPFQSTDQVAVKHLILTGLVEHWGFLDTTLNPDLDDISTAYRDGIFLVAVAGNPAEAGNQIVGTGALIPEDEGLIRIVRMSVDKNFRRKGIGRRILSELCDIAKKCGYKQIALETTETWEEAIHFYQQNGFQMRGNRDGDMHFLLDI
ncbi:MAG: N-acetyltransferase [Chloroflexi bacterium]|nr:MAG: N-acetyltransferase [Chloroflexota bacterium]